MKAYATVAGIKILNEWYKMYQDDWKLVARKAKVYLKKRNIDFEEIEEFVVLSTNKNDNDESD